MIFSLVAYIISCTTHEDFPLDGFVATRWPHNLKVHIRFGFYHYHLLLFATLLHCKCYSESLDSCRNRHSKMQCKT